MEAYLKYKETNTSWWLLNFSDLILSAQMGSRKYLNYVFVTFTKFKVLIWKIFILDKK